MISARHQYESENVMRDQKIHIENVVLSTHLHTVLDLDDVCRKFIAWLGNKEFVSYTYSFPACHVKYNKCNTAIFESGAINCVGPNIQRARKTVREVIKKLDEFGMLKLASTKTPIVKIASVMGTSSLNQSVGCGIVQAIFPDSTLSKFAGGSINIKTAHGSIRVFSTGKLIGTGFKSEQKIIDTINEVKIKILENLNKHQIARLEYCRIERYEPALEVYRKLIDVFPQFDVAEKIYGEDLLAQYLQKVQSTSMGMEPKTLGCCIVYILSLIYNKGIVQRDIKEEADISEPAIRNNYLGIGKILELDVITKRTNSHTTTIRCDECNHFSDDMEWYIFYYSKIYTYKEIRSKCPKSGRVIVLNSLGIRHGCKAFSFNPNGRLSKEKRSLLVEKVKKLLREKGEEKI